MKPIKFIWYDYVIFILMVGFSITIGLYYGIFDKSSAGASNYFSGLKQLKVLPISISLIASFLTVTDLLAIPAEVYMHGTQYWVTIFSVPVMGLFINYIYLPVAYKLGVNSTFEYLELRFDKTIKQAGTIIFTLCCILYAPLLVLTPTLAFSQVTGFNTHYVRWIVTLICIFYTTIGGLKAVIWSDTLQFVITVLTLILSLVVGVTNAGGFVNVWSLAKQGSRIEFFRIDPDPTLRATFWSVFIGNTFYWTALTTVHPASTQRLLSVKTLKDARSVLLIFCAGMIITKSIVCLLGLVMYAKYSNCDPLSIGLIERADQIVPFYVLDTVRQIPGIRVLFISGLFSMCFSVLSTFLNILAYLVYSDVVLKIFPRMSDKMGSYATKGLTVLMGLISVGLISVVERLGSIFEVTFIVSGIIAGALFGLLVLGLIFPCSNTKGAYCGGIASVTFMSFIIFKTNTYIWNGDIKHQTKPLHIDGCHVNFTVESNYVNSSYSISNEKGQPIWLFRISFHYYILIGSLIVIVVGLLTSLLTRRNCNSSVKEELICPIILRLLKRNNIYKYHHPVIEIKVNEESTI